MYRVEVIAISIHALREEGDATATKIALQTGQFLSTPSARRATRVVKLSSILLEISIHALREEGDDVTDFSYCPNCGFLSTPSARRATCAGCYAGEPVAISIHALREEGDVLDLESAVR